MQLSVYQKQRSVFSDMPILLSSQNFFSLRNQAKFVFIHLFATKIHSVLVF